MAVVQESEEGKGGKLLALNLRELQNARKELDTAANEADRLGDFPEEIRAEVEEAVDLLPQLERQVADAQDRLEAAK